jgi:transposase
LAAAAGSSCCGRSTAPARSCSWTTPAPPFPFTTLESGEVWEAAIFVAVLGASNYTYAEASLTQGLADWIGAHMRAFEFLGGVPEIVTPDNLKSGVTKACRYEPGVNRTYEEMAAHYGVAVVPARPA